MNATRHCQICNAPEVVDGDILDRLGLNDDGVLCCEDCYCPKGFVSQVVVSISETEMDLLLTSLSNLLEKRYGKVDPTMAPVPEGYHTLASLIARLANEGIRADWYASHDVHGNFTL